MCIKSGSNAHYGHHAHKYSKMLKRLLLQNRWSDFHEAWYVVSGTLVHHGMRLFKVQVIS